MKTPLVFIKIYFQMGWFNDSHFDLCRFLETKVGFLNNHQVVLKEFVKENLEKNLLLEIGQMCWGLSSHYFQGGLSSTQ